MSSRLLLLDPDPLSAKLLAFLLGDAGYQTTPLADPRQVDDFLTENAVDLILLDVLLPYIDGLSLCTTLRREHPDIPIIFLSARSMVADRVAGLQAGADDYLAKPFEPTEVLARVQTVLRRYRRAERHCFGTLIRAGDTALDLSTLQFTASTRRSVLLTPTEMKLLECLMRNAGAVVARETLIERTWGYDFDGESNRVEVYIRRLRQKIEVDPGTPVYLHTVRGMGYRFRTGGVAARPVLHMLDAERGGTQDRGRAQRWRAIGA